MMYMFIYQWLFDVWFKIGLSPSKKACFISVSESFLKMMENVFYFILKALSCLKIFKLLP